MKAVVRTCARPRSIDLPFRLRAGRRLCFAIYCSGLGLGLVGFGAHCTIAPAPAGAAPSLSAPDCAPASTPAELRDRAVSLLPPEFWRATLTPVLPSGSPEPDGGVFYLVYRRDALPSGRQVFGVSGPYFRINFATLRAEPTLEILAGEADLGVEEGPPETVEFRRALEGAERTVLEYVAGCRGAEGLSAELDAYRSWLQRRTAIALDLRLRGVEFVAPLLPAESRPAETILDSDPLFLELEKQ